MLRKNFPHRRALRKSVVDQHQAKILARRQIADELIAVAKAQAEAQAQAKAAKLAKVAARRRRPGEITP